MTMTKIPDIAFEINGDLINIEQDAGCGETHLVQLHKLHLELRQGIEWLHDSLEAVPSFPPQDLPSQEVEHAWYCLGQIDRILKLAGIDRM